MKLFYILGNNEKGRVEIDHLRKQVKSALHSESRNLIPIHTILSRCNGHR